MSRLPSSTQSPRRQQALQIDPFSISEYISHALPWCPHPHSVCKPLLTYMNQFLFPYGLLRLYVASLIIIYQILFLASGQNQMVIFFPSVATICSNCYIPRVRSKLYSSKRETNVLPLDLICSGFWYTILYQNSL